VILLGNAVAFAGVDPVTRWVTAVLCLVLAVDLTAMPAVPRWHRWMAWGLGALIVAQLIPLPVAIRAALQPGFADVMAPGWAPLSLSPWATLRMGAAAVVLAVVALTAARMAATRSGLPTLLGLIAATAGALGVMGLAGEAGAPDKVLLIRDNLLGGGVYGPYVNSNHFAQGMELALPAALVLLAVAGRQVSRAGVTRQRAVVLSLMAGVVVAVGGAAALRCGSRGGVVFLGVGLLASIPWWRRPITSRRWPWAVAALVVAALVASLAATRIDDLREGFSQLLAIEGVDGNDRWDLWAGTVASWRRAPLLGAGLGSFRYVIGMDKPATGTAILEQGHNDWLEFVAGGGLGAVLVLVAGVGGLIWVLRPGRVRRMRFELRYPLAGVIWVGVSTAFHEWIGFGLQTPLNGLLAACWIGIVWGVAGRRGGIVGKGDGETADGD
jgi:hypothetical protein